MAHEHQGQAAFVAAASGLDEARRQLAEGKRQGANPEIALACFSAGALGALIAIGDAIQANTTVVHDSANLLAPGRFLGEKWAQVITPQKASPDDPS